MLKLLTKSKVFSFVLIVINISSLIASEISYQSNIQSQSFFANNGNIIKQLYNEDGLLVYDKVIQLVKELENGALDDICTDKDWYEINHFLTFLAGQGLLSDAPQEKIEEIEKDIDELLYFNKSSVVSADDCSNMN